MRRRVVGSHAPLLVKMGVRIWKAKSVPVGSRFAKLAVLVRVRDSGEGLAADEAVPVAPACASELDGCLVVVGRCLTDILLFCV